MATIFEIVRNATPFMGMEDLDSLYGNTEQEAREVSVIVNQCAEAISLKYDWQVLTKTHKFVGDGQTDVFDPPPDFKRMHSNTDLWSSDRASPFQHIADDNEFLGLEVRGYGAALNCWAWREGKIKTIPEIGSGVDAQFLYITKNHVLASDGTSKESFTADTDAYRLDDELLRLGIIYFYKAFKKMPFSSEEDDFLERYSALIGSDKPVRQITIGKPRLSRIATVAYPGSIKV